MVVVNGGMVMGFVSRLRGGGYSWIQSPQFQDVHELWVIWWFKGKEYET